MIVATTNDAKFKTNGNGSVNKLSEEDGMENTKTQTTKPEVQEEPIMPEVRHLYKGFMLDKELGFCVRGDYAGWLMARHPDGQWVTLAKLPTTHTTISFQEEKK